MKAEDVKAALYGRHPGGVFPAPGPWTCLEEWNGIDFLAFSAWGSQGGFARVGYEVKVSRSDLRAELLRPHKRARNVGWCNEFYLAVPKGLLKPDELAWDEPEWEPGDFARTPCRYASGGALEPDWRAPIGPCRKGRRYGLLVGPEPKPWGWDEGKSGRLYRDRVEYTCDGCGGQGHEGLSRVERDAPTVWIPRDVGLVEVDGRGTNVARKAPRRKTVEALSATELGRLVRWVSMRPDPRHATRREQHLDRFDAA